MVESMDGSMTATKTMKAVRIHTFGGPDVLQLEDVPVPEPKADEVLVRIHAAGVNPVDWKIREGMVGSLSLPSIMGSDFSGVIESAGSQVKAFFPGDEVFGSVSDDSGSYAEHATAPVSQITMKSAALSHVQAAALPIAGLTAWQALFDKADVQPGQRVLIHAAAGGVGHLAVQFAKWKGAYVFGTASEKNAKFVRGLGADLFIAYRTEQFEDIARDVDMVLDTMGGATQERSWKTLKPGGILVSLVQEPSKAPAGVRGVLMRADHARPDELAKIGELVAAGTVRVDISTVLPLKEERKSHELSQQGRTRGKIV